MSSPLLLAIESSCDDTSAAVLHGTKVLSNLTANQKVHEKYGGVVPELASRAHQSNILPVVVEALKQANVTLNKIEGIAFTEGPGLLGSLLVGGSFSKGLAWAMNKPMVTVNHMQAHILAHFVENEQGNYPKFPFLCLTVSGGHTQLVFVKAPLDMEIVGETMDDAVGEAFDKIAKLLGLPYPGGPEIDRWAKDGNPMRFSFPESEVAPLSFSFSGIKTAVLYFLQREKQKNPNFIEENLADICASVQHNLVTVLLKKLSIAEEKYQTQNLALAGGVAANSELRTRFHALGKEIGARTFIPKFEYCTDNAAMIGAAGYFLWKAKQFSPLSITPKPRMTFS